MDATRPEGLNALHADASQIVIPQPVSPPQPINANVEEFCKQVQDNDAANQMLNQVLHRQQDIVRQPVQKKNNRKYTKNNRYSQEQRDLFQSLYSKHLKKWTLAKYALEVGVPLGIIASWRSKMIHHQSLQYRSNRNSYRNLISDEELLALSNMLDNGDASMTEKDMRDELEKEFPDSPKVSLETISRALHGKRMEDLVGRDYSLKMGSFRSSSANNDVNKERRIQVMAELYKYISQGRIWVSIDETHWEVNSRRKRAWSKVGQKAFTNFIPRRTEFSSITAIDERGYVASCLVVKGPVNADVFTDFFTKLVNQYKNESAVFFLDNASVHDKEELKRIGEDDKHAVVFNAPYSEELNPIEMFFNEWKAHVDEKIKKWPGIDAFLDVLKDSVLKIPPSHIRSLFEHVRNTVLPKVVRKEDL